MSDEKQAVRDLAMALTAIESAMDAYQAIDTDEPSSVDLDEVTAAADAVLDAARAVISSAASLRRARQ